MPGRDKLEKTSGLRLDQFCFTEVHHLKGQRPEAPMLAIHWKEIKRERGWVLLWTQQQKTHREKTLSQTVYKEQQHFHLCQHRC